MDPLTVITAFVQIVGGFLTLVVYSFTVFGFVYVVGHAEITQPARDALFGSGGITPGLAVRRFILNLIECPACLSWWGGFITSCSVFYYVLAAPFWPATLITFAFAFYSAGTSFVLGRLTGLISLK